MSISLFLTLAFLPLFPRLTAAATPQQSQQVPAEEAKDLCNYLKDVEAKTDADCVEDDWASEKVQNRAAYDQKLSASRKRKADVHRSYDFLRTRVPAATELQPPINERTFFVWIGPEAAEFKTVYTRWLESQSRWLEQERQSTENSERRKQIDTALAANQARVEGLKGLKDPSEFVCFLGEACGTRSDLDDPAGTSVLGATRRAWTSDDYRRANEEEADRGIRVPGGKIDRGVPGLGMVASEVVDSSPLGPLKGNAGDKHGSTLGTVAAMAFATTGALLLFGGLGGKMLEEKFPNIRRNMGIAAAATGTIAIGAAIFPEVAPAVLRSPPVIEGTRRAIEGAESPRGQQFIARVSQGIQRSGQRIAQPFQRILASEAGAISPRSGTVWNYIKPTQPNWPSTEIPRSFELTITNGRLWVHPNATKHMYNFLGKVKAPENLQYRPPVQSQVLLESFRGAIEKAASRGISYGRMVRIDGWEIIIQPGGQTGPLPTVVHAVYHH